MLHEESFPESAHILTTKTWNKHNCIFNYT